MMERKRQTRGNGLCSAALSGAASKLGPPGISEGMPDITLIPQQQQSPSPHGRLHAGAGRDAPGCDVSTSKGLSYHSPLDVPLAHLCIHIASCLCLTNSTLTWGGGGHNSEHQRQPKLCSAASRLRELVIIVVPSKKPGSGI